jgi:hypothetical protein
MALPTIVSMRQRAQRRTQQREYQEILAEKQRQTGPLTPIPSTSVSSVSSWDALNQRLQEHRIRDHAKRMRDAHNLTRDRVQRILNRREATSKQNTDEIDRIDPEDTLRMPVIGRSTTQPLALSARRESTILREMANLHSGIDYAINRYIGRFGLLPASIRVSSYNHLMLALEGKSGDYTNAFGTFVLLSDFALPDTTIICEE